jgi:hypothetical protein
LTHPHSPETDDRPATIVMVRPWIDPLVDEDGFDPRSRYVETFWLGVLGPTATWLLRRLVAGLEQHPEGYELDLAATALTMGLRYHPDRVSPFSRALQRCTMFGVAHHLPNGIAVRRRVPAVAHRHLRRLPESVRIDHDRWLRADVGVDDLDRAHRLAMTLVDVGDETDLVEHRLVALGVPDTVASQVADNVLRLGASATPSAPHATA